MCFVWVWEQTAIISLYSSDWLVFITETECVYCAVPSTFYVLPTQCIYVFCVGLRTNSGYFTVHQRTAYLNIIQINVILNPIQCQCTLNLWQQSGTDSGIPPNTSVFPCFLQAHLHLHTVRLVTGSFLKVCHRSDPKLDECVMDSVEGLRSHLVTGKEFSYKYFTCSCLCSCHYCRTIHMCVTWRVAILTRRNPTNSSSRTFFLRTAKEAFMCRSDCAALLYVLYTQMCPQP